MACNITATLSDRFEDPDDEDPDDEDSDEEDPDDEDSDKEDPDDTRVTVCSRTFWIFCSSAFCLADAT